MHRFDEGACFACCRDGRRRVHACLGLRAPVCRMRMRMRHACSWRRAGTCSTPAARSGTQGAWTSQVSAQPEQQPAAWRRWLPSGTPPCREAVHTRVGHRMTLVVGMTTVHCHAYLLLSMGSACIQVSWLFGRGWLACRRRDGDGAQAAQHGRVPLRQLPRQAWGKLPALGPACLARCACCYSLRPAAMSTLLTRGRAEAEPTPSLAESAHAVSEAIGSGPDDGVSGGAVRNTPFKWSRASSPLVCHA